MFGFNLVVRRAVESLVTLVSLLLNIRKRCLTFTVFIYNPIKMCYLTTEEYQGHVLIGGLISYNSHPSGARATGSKKIE
jgi:hypothetical protein